MGWANTRVMPVNLRNTSTAVAAGVAAAVIAMLVIRMTDYNPREMDEAPFAAYVGVKAFLGVLVASYVV